LPLLKSSALDPDGDEVPHGVPSGAIVAGLSPGRKPVGPDNPPPRGVARERLFHRPGVKAMRQFAAFLILVALFVVLVATRFQASDGDKLAAVARLAGAKIRNALPPAANLSAPVDALRRELPTRPEDAVKARLAADKRLAGVTVNVVAEGATVKLRGVVPDAKTRKVIVSLAENTAGVEKVVDELAIPEKASGGREPPE
jgi:hypothetical protein